MRPLREAAQQKVLKFQNAYANDHSINFLPAIAGTTGRIDAEFLRLLFWHAHRESKEIFKLTGQLAETNQDSVFSKRVAFFNSLKSKVGHIMAKASALRVTMNLPPTIPSTSLSSTPNSHAPLIYALNLSHHVLPPYREQAREMHLPPVVTCAPRSSIFLSLYFGFRPHR